MVFVPLRRINLGVFQFNLEMYILGFHLIMNNLEPSTHRKPCLCARWPNGQSIRWLPRQNYLTLNFKLLG